MSDRIYLEECTGPFSDARDCPVHRPEIASMLPLQNENRPVIADPRDAELSRLRAEVERLARERSDAYQDFCVGNVTAAMRENELRTEIDRLEADCDARVTAIQVERDTFRIALKKTHARLRATTQQLMTLRERLGALDVLWRDRAATADACPSEDVEWNRAEAHASRRCADELSALLIPAPVAQGEMKEKSR